MEERICERCGCVIGEDDNFSYVDEDIICEECAATETVICAHCGDRIWARDAVSDDSIYICQECYDDHYRRCEGCGRLIDDNDVYWHNDLPYCCSCYDDFDDDGIEEYSYKPEPLFRGDGKRFFGVELEVDCGGKDGDNAYRIMQKGKIMLTETTVLKSKALFSDDRKHRLLLKKEWDSNKPNAMIIMINPNTADTTNADMTTMLVLNNLCKLGFGSVSIVNLYSRITEKLSLRFNSDDDLIDHDTDRVIEEYAAMSNAIIIAWGSIGRNTQRVRERQQELLEMLSVHKNKFYKIGKDGCHPLTPAVRSGWELEPYEMEEIENA